MSPPQEVETRKNLARVIDPTFLKPSASSEDVSLLRSVPGASTRAKAAGNMGTLASALAMIGAGADRIGTSASMKMMGEWDRIAGGS